MKKLVLSLLFTLTIGIMAGCVTLPVSSSPEESGVGDRSKIGITESVEPELTEEPEASDVPEVTQELMPTATPKPTPTQAPVIDRNVVERDAYAVNAKNGKIHRTGDCPATGSGENAMTNPVYFPTYEEAEAYSIKIKKSLDKRKCGNCWR